MIHFSLEAAGDLERVREFLDINNPEAAKRALRTIFAALERVEEFPDLGRPTEDAAIRQIVIPFGAAGYIVRYTILPDDGDVLVLRLWHGREARSEVSSRPRHNPRSISSINPRSRGFHPNSAPARFARTRLFEPIVSLAGPSPHSAAASSTVMLCVRSPKPSMRLIASHTS